MERIHRERVTRIEVGEFKLWIDKRTGEIIAGTRINPWRKWLAMVLQAIACFIIGMWLGS